MSVQEIEQAITNLQADDLAELRAWFARYDSAEWDKQIEADSNAGKLDALINAALTSHRAGKSRLLSEDIAPAENMGLKR